MWRQTRADVVRDDTQPLSTISYKEGGDVEDLEIGEMNIAAHASSHATPGCPRPSNGGHISALLGPQGAVPGRALRSARPGTGHSEKNSRPSSGVTSLVTRVPASGEEGQVCSTNRHATTGSYPPEVSTQHSELPIEDPPLWGPFLSFIEALAGCQPCDVIGNKANRNVWVKKNDSGANALVGGGGPGTPRAYGNDRSRSATFVSPCSSSPYSHDVHSSSAPVGSTSRRPYTPHEEIYLSNITGQLPARVRLCPYADNAMPHAARRREQAHTGASFIVQDKGHQTINTGDDDQGSSSLSIESSQPEYIAFPESGEVLPLKRVSLVGLPSRDNMTSELCASVVDNTNMYLEKARFDRDTNLGAPNRMHPAADWHSDQAPRQPSLSHTHTHSVRSPAPTTWSPANSAKPREFKDFVSAPLEYSTLEDEKDYLWSELSQISRDGRVRPEEWEALLHLRHRGGGGGAASAAATEEENEVLRLQLKSLRAAAKRNQFIAAELERESERVGIQSIANHASMSAAAATGEAEMDRDSNMVWASSGAPRRTK